MEDSSFRNAEEMERECYKRPNRDYSKHINWTYNLNKDLYECYIQSEHERIGYMKRLKALRDNKRPELAHLSERHLENKQVE